MISGRDAFAAAGVTPAEIDVAELYDCFTITIIVELEDIGFCPKGEGGRFRPGRKYLNRWSNSCDRRTAGSFPRGIRALRAACFMWSKQCAKFAARAGERQVKDVELALAHGNGGIIGLHCTLILGRT